LPDFVPADEEIRHERLRIARDLHDTVAQRLAGFGFALDTTIADEAIPSDRKRDLRQIRLEVSSIVQELRQEILALRQDQCSSIEEWLRDRLAIEITWSRVEEAVLGNGGIEEMRYLLLELLRNACKHSGLSRTTIEERSRAIDVIFMDFTAQKESARSPFEEGVGSVGRIGIHERTNRLGARLEERAEGFAIRW
jgi:nitrate/nitrite-specific signal transduction histidine kinase